VAAWLMMEGAGDVAEEIADSSHDEAKWSTVRPRVILTYFLVIAVAVCAFLVARWVLKGAT
jgi:hypothetical protein